MEATAKKATFQKYSAYKDSGVEWLGQIPAHWDMLPNKFIFKLKKNLVGKKSNQYTLLSLTLHGIIKRDMENPQGKFPAEFDTYQEVNNGDFVFCLFDVEETPRCVGLSDFDGMITGAYTVMQVGSKFDKRFLYYFYLNLDKDKRLRPLYTGLRNTISKDNFFAFKAFVPPLPEQTAIAAFLDDKTAKIDRAIAQKEKMIALLKERKQIIIQNAVTKGLDPNTKMKHSGVEWIGEIPEGWIKIKLRWLSKIYAGGTPDKNNLRFWENGNIPWIASGEVNQEFIKTPTTYITTLGFNHSAARWMRKGDLVVALAGQGKTKGTVAYLEIDTTGNQSLSCVSPNKDIIESKFLYFFIKAAYNELRGVSGEGQRDGLNLQKLGDLEICIPKMVDQRLIVAYIETQSAKIDKAIKLQEQQIEKLKELKSTLIDSAVTGKLRVPSVQEIKVS